MKKLRVGILFGGRSGEHEISLLSAASVFNAIDKNKYEVVPIGITKQGRWVTAADAERLLPGKFEGHTHLRAGDPEATPGAAILAEGEAVIVPPEPQRHGSIAPFQTDAASHALTRRASDRAINVDIIFPVLHGTFGEDGTIQGLLELADMAYVGAGVLGSAAGMDKDVMKSLFPRRRVADREACDRSSLRLGERDPKKVQKLVRSKLKYPVFVKPANLGSSVGISKVHDRKELGPAIEEAAKFDRKIVVEQGVGGKKQKAREIECSVLGNDQPEASLPGEIIPGKEFYDYTAKYLDEGSELVIPAKLTKSGNQKGAAVGRRAFQAVDCSGLARVDFLMEPKTRKLYLNEINTMPGFTSISMYPKMWAATGMSYSDLIGRLIQLGMERHEDKKKNQYSR